MTTAAAHTAAPFQAIGSAIDSGQVFRTFRAFADACAERLAPDATKDDAVQLCAILTAARDHRGAMPYRMLYALGLARHCADNPLER